jgi:hypothetical protein
MRTTASAGTPANPAPDSRYPATARGPGLWIRAATVPIVVGALMMATGALLILGSGCYYLEGSHDCLVMMNLVVMSELFVGVGAAVTTLGLALLVQALVRKRRLSRTSAVGEG